MSEIVQKYFKGDRIIWGVILGLSIFSVLAVYSSTGTLAYKYQGGNTGYYILKHATFLFIGLIIVYITHLIPYKFFSRLSQLFVIITVPLLAITLIMGAKINEASRWLTLPGLGFTVQTSDFAKLALIMYIARFLSIRQDKVKDFKTTFLPLIFPVLLICGLILPANLSTAMILFGTSVVLMFIGRIDFRYILLLFIFLIGLLAAFILVAKIAGYEGRIKTWENRIENFRSGEGNEDGNYQADQSKIAISTGGIFGKGPGNSVQRNFLPHPYSDFIYAIIVEEYGSFGGLIILLFYLILFFRAGIIVRRSSRTFPAFLAIGLTLMLIFQAIVNMAVAVGIMPVTGQPLPLVSMGGSSMLFSCTALGVILSVSRSTKDQVVNTEGVGDE